MANWYVLHIRSNHEKKVKRFLENLQMEFPESVKQILLPTEQVQDVKEGKKESKTQFLMPGYIMVEVEPSKEIIHSIRKLPGVLDVLGSDASPDSLSENEVANIFSLVEERKEKPAPRFEFNKGDRVEIREGPFLNFAGLVEEVILDKEKIKVSVSIFGRSTMVELDMWQVEKV
ncbi:MAG: transcription termination/antitermination protein NusG [Candidatus Ratteibacteria bacterium]|jgi:transcriptional antiterminator NusG